MDCNGFCSQCDSCCHAGSLLSWLGKSGSIAFLTSSSASSGRRDLNKKKTSQKSEKCELNLPDHTQSCSWN